MNNTSEIIEKAFNELNNNDVINKLLRQESIIQSEVNDYYHVLELVSINAADLSKIVKNFRILLRRRREIKEQISICRSFIDNHKNKIADREKCLKSYNKQAHEAFSRITKSISKQEISITEPR